jgi:hypothetical protein
MLNMNEYPLYPELSEEGKKEAQQLIENFKVNLLKAAEEVIATLYCDVINDIESDSWANFRNQIMCGFKNYENRKIQNRWDFKIIREEIFKEFKMDIISDLDKDILNENEQLKKQIDDLNKIIENLRKNNYY